MRRLLRGGTNLQSSVRKVKVVKMAERDGWSALQAFFISQQGIDTTTPAGKALFGMMGVFAEFERSMIQARVKAGIKRVRAKGSTGDGGKSRKQTLLFVPRFRSFGNKAMGWERSGNGSD